MEAEAEAWDLYLESCAAAPPGHYEAVEVWAWDRLTAQLAELIAAAESGEDK